MARLDLPPIYHAVCRECLQGGKSPSCWHCQGDVTFEVESEAEADVIFRVWIDGATGIGESHEYTERMKAWLAEVEGQ